LDFKAFLEALKNTNPRTRMVALLAVVAIGFAIAIGGWVAGQPNFVLLYSSLDDNARAGVEKALAGGSIRYRVSQPPAPFNVYVDESQYYGAQNLVALSGALKEMPRGIDTSATGASTIFMSSQERAQSVLKRDWQEMERQLETLDFVASAAVATSMPDSSPIGDKKPPTVSVTLGLKNLTELSREQAENVAKLVRFRFGVPAENVVISDQSGNTLFDPTRAQNFGADPHSLLEYASGYDHELAEKVNRQLAAAYGEKKAIVSVTSEWDHDQRTTVSETLSPKGTLVSEKTTKTETPQGGATVSGAGGPAGTSSNLASDQGFGVDNAAQPGANPAAASAPPATSSDVSKTYETARSKTQTVHATPVLERLSVSVLLDESLAAKKDEISSIVQAAVGFSTERKDVIQVGTTTFATDSTAKDSSGEQKPAPSGGMSPMVESLLKRAIEIVSAIAFLFVLFKTLKGAPGARTAAAYAGGGSIELGGAAGAHASADAEPDPELLARARIEELVRTDPRRVGEILSRWAGERRDGARAGK
jgi:flagellar M-ring protein FliF